MLKEQNKMRIFSERGQVEHVSKTDVDDGRQETTAAITVLVSSSFAITTVTSGFATCSYLSPAILSAIAFRWRHCALVITLFS